MSCSPRRGSLEERASSSVTHRPNHLPLIFKTEARIEGKSPGHCVSRGRDRLLCSFLGHQKAEKCESLAAGAWFLEHGLPWAAVCLVTFNRGLFRLILKGGV